MSPPGQPAGLGCLGASTRTPLVAICQLTPQLLGVNPWNPFTGAATIREPIVTDTRALSPFVTIWPRRQIFWAKNVRSMCDGVL